MQPYFSPFDPDVSIPTEDLMPHAAPLWLRHGETPSDTIVICLHGFTATPYEAKPVADAVFKLGMDAACLLFPAHGWKDLSRAKRAMGEFKYTELLTAVRAEIKRARQQYTKIYIYGQSMGGATALAIAEELLVDACATTAPAIKLPPHGVLAAKFVGRLNLNLPANDSGEFFNESYKFNNARAVRQLNLLAKHARDNLHNITCPVLECHSMKDTDISPKITEWIKNRVQGPVKIEWYNESGHTMPLDVQGKEICVSIAQFFNNLREA